MNRLNQYGVRYGAVLMAIALMLTLQLGTVSADETYHNICTSNFSQNWTDTSLITTNNDWSGVPSIVGYRGDGLAGGTAVDPQTILVDGSGTPVNVNANQTNPNTYTTGGVTEFHITDPVVALQGSGTARAPHLVIHLNTTDATDVTVSYNIRDIDGSSDNSVQPVAAHFRVGNTGNYINIPDAFVADASTGPNEASLVTPVSFTLPISALNQSDVQVRIMTSDAVGSDEWVGIDDIVISANCDAPTTPPAVTSISPANGATNIPVSTNIVVTFDQVVDLDANALTVECPMGTPYSASTTQTGVTSVTVNGPLPYGVTCYAEVHRGLVANINGNMDSDYSFTFTTEPDPALICTTATTTFIEDAVPADPGDPAITYTIKGVVTADYESVGGTPPVLNGIYMQDSPSPDDPNKSNGIFVYTGTTARGLSVGDELLITGPVSEYQGQRQISPSSITNCGTSSLPAPTLVSLPIPAGTSITDYYKRYEGMIVQFADTLTITELYLFGRFGQMTLSQGGRLTQFTQFNAPSVSGYNNHLDDVARRSIILDDISQAQNEDPAFPTGGFSLNNLVRGGYTIDNLTGILTYTWSGNSASPNTWRVRPVDGASYVFNADNPRPTTPPNVGGTLQVSAMNVLNYFVTTGAGYQCGPAGTTQCRGADNATELVRQQDKLVSALCTMDASVIGLMEIENPRTSDTTDAPVSTLTNALNNASINCGTYDFIHTGTIGGDAIKNALIYQPAEVTPIGPFFILDDEFPFQTNTRPPLAQVFEENTSGERFIAVINHFKSKGCSADATGTNADLGDGQSCWNADRVTAATVMVDWLDELQTTTGVDRVVILGDLNSQAQEDPMQVLYNAGYSNLYDLSEYGYVFNGMWGTMDYALGSPAFTANVTGARSWNINADEASIVDYNMNFKSTSQIANFYNADPFRSSDHDPVIVGVSMPPAERPVVIDVTDANGLTLDGEIYTENINELTIQFNINVFDDGTGSDPDSASNPANYIVLTEGAVSGFQTASCVAGVSPDDEQIIPVMVTYDPVSYVTTLTFDPVLENGTYRLIICGTTSIVAASNTNLHLNDGVDVVVEFSIDITPTATATPTETTVAPTETTVTPTETTVAPTETPSTPIGTTIAPTGTAVAPTETTIAPIGTPVTPTETTVAPIGTPVAPIETSIAPTQPLSPEELGVKELPATGETPFWAELLRRILGA